MSLINIPNYGVVDPIKDLQNSIQNAGTISENPIETKKDAEVAKTPTLADNINAICPNPDFSGSNAIFNDVQKKLKENLLDFSKKAKDNINDAIQGNVHRSDKYIGPFKRKAKTSEDQTKYNTEIDNTIYHQGVARENTLDINGFSALDIPNWGYKDYINERVEWQKGLNSLLNEPAWFYFKIFFKFDTQYGLFGGIINDDIKGNDAGDLKEMGFGSTVNSAIKYLNINSKNKRHVSLNLYSKTVALYKFVKTLSYISCNAPWFFNAVHDVNNALTVDTDNLSKQKSIVIDCLEESVDMKLMTMMDLYKMVVYDDNFQVEVLPENLRKFDMDIVVFQAPLRYLHTSAIDLRQRTSKYKRLNGTSFDERMSFKIFTFKNCEFDYQSLNGMLPSNFTNDKPFSSKPTIKINYDRVYQHTSNEFAGLFFGSGGFYDGSNRVPSTIEADKMDLENVNAVYNPKTGAKEFPDVNVIGTNLFKNIDSNRKEMLKYAEDHPNYYNLNSSVYKSLVDASEANIYAAMKMIDGSSGLGNLYTGSKSLVDAITSTAKDTYKNTINKYKDVGLGFYNRWKF